MTDNMIGMTCALSAAFVWAFAMVLFKKSGEKVPPLALNLFKNVVSIVLLSLTLVVMGDGLESLKETPPADIWILILSGFIGITLADTLFFYSLNLIGVSIVAIAECLYTPFIIFFSWMLLSEGLVLEQYLGAALILAAVFITTRLKPPEGRTRGQLVAGVLLSVVTMGIMTFGIVIAKPALERMPMIWATLIRLAGGTVVLVLFVACLPARGSLFAVFRPSRTWRWSVPGSVLGAYLALIFWIAGFKYTDASVAGILNQTNTIFAIILATLLLKESFSRRKLAALVLAMGGIALVTWFQR